MRWSDSARPGLTGLAIVFAFHITIASAQVPASVPLPPKAAAANGPAGTSGMGAARYDAVGLAEIAPVSEDAAAQGEGPVTAAHSSLSPGTLAEVTALGSGQTILVLVDRTVARTEPQREIILSPAAARLLALDGKSEAAVRVRGVVASAADLAALKAGRPAARRLAAPPALLTALRQRLRPPSVEPVTVAQRPAASAPKAAPAASRPAVAKASTVKSTPPPPSPRAAQGKYLVQVAALSDAARARALAKTLDGHVETSGKLHRIRLGPFADMKSAQRARDDAKRRGYGDATILTQP